MIRIVMTDPEISTYAEEMSSPEPALIRELVGESVRELEFTDMLSGPVVGNLLAMLVRITAAERVLEIGTFTGYSALWIASALPEEGEVITCEYNERYEQLARRYFDRSEHSRKIRLVMGKALETIPRLNGDFDLVFLDADKGSYPAYYELVLPRLKEGGLMVIDNVLWQGEVLAGSKSETAEMIDRTNRMIAEDRRVEQVMLTVRDGLTIVRKTSR